MLFLWQDIKGLLKNVNPFVIHFIFHKFEFMKTIISNYDYNITDTSERFTKSISFTNTFYKHNNIGSRAMLLCWPEMFL